MSTTIEHIVLFKLKPNTPLSKVYAMLTGLNRLISLHHVTYISAGPLHRTGPPLSNFTHMLHSRYSSKQNLAAYSANPSHVSVVKGSVLPICDDIMAVDWVAVDLPPNMLLPGSGVRVRLLKLKENLGEEAKIKVLETIKLSFGGEIIELSIGENFSPARAKGFSIAALAVFPGSKEMESVDANLHIEKVRDYLDDAVVVDYVVQPVNSSSKL